MKVSFTTVDVFTTTRYAGNPVAVVHVPSSVSKVLSQHQKQLIAKEFNLSETVFVHETDEPVVAIDIFTHQAEIPFAGHPTIGTAFHVLSSNASVTALLTKAGKIPVTQTDGYVRAEVPHDIHIHSMTISSAWTKKAAPVVSIVKGMTFILAELSDIDSLSQASENLVENTYDATGLDKGWDEGLLATYFYVVIGTDDTGKKIIRSRMFGSREDPATGSAASALGGYLALMDTFHNKGPSVYAITQGVEMGRKSEIGVEVTKNVDGQSIATVVLRGQAVEVMEGTLSF